jgi:hypothetical protein
MTKTAQYVALLIVLWTGSVLASDSAVVRIRVDLDSVLLEVNGASVAEDSYGSPIEALNWFVLQLTPGSYEFRFTHPAHPEQLFQLELDSGDVESIEPKFIVMDSTVDSVAYPMRILSSPDSGFITIDSGASDSLTPAVYSLLPGKYAIEVFKDGFEPLQYDLIYSSSHPGALNFILKPLAPEPVVAESLGLEYFPVVPLQDERIADEQMQKFSSMSELFLIVPLAQGLVARALLAEEDKQVANIMIASGVVLTAGSYLLGKLVSNRTRKRIIEENAEIESQNARAQVANRDVDREVREFNAQMQQQWKEENSDRGRVEVQRVE